MKPTLLILAAGMGSRYGSLKQMDGVGPNNEGIIEYSVYDAIRAGFGKVVFVIRRQFEQDFKEKYHHLFSDKIQVEYVYQEINSPIEGIDKMPERTKPWGTGHAVLMADGAIHEPFLMINADDYYGVDAFKKIAKYLMNGVTETNYCMVGYRLKNTLSDNGTVSRGVCSRDVRFNLKAVVETHQIERKADGKIGYPDKNGNIRTLKDNTIVSMNFFGFHPSLFATIRAEFIKFVKANEDNPKAEFYIGLVVNELIEAERISMRILNSEDQWYGVTYKEDKEVVKSAFKALVEDKTYPNNLWAK